jgi:hypothetical protein
MDKQRIVIIVEGGVIQNIEDIPPNVIVEVRDYDTDTDDYEEGDNPGPGYRKDPMGDVYSLGEWEAE